MFRRLILAASAAAVLLAPFGLHADAPQGASESASAYAVTAEAAGAHASGSQGVDPRALELFRDALLRIRNSYVDPRTDRELVEAAIAGMTASLDPHSKFLGAEAFRNLRRSNAGRFIGLGVRFRMEEGAVRVTETLPGSPAERAGVQAGDLITHIDRQPLAGLALEQVQQRMRGAAGTRARFTLDRAGQVVEVEVERGVVESPSVAYRAEGDVGYIQIRRFSAQTHRQLEQALAGLERELGGRLVGYVLDLRSNPGGLIDQAVAVADSFLEAGTIMSTRGRDGVELRRYTAGPGDLAHGRPIVVVVNANSASSSEIVAAALQEHGRAMVLGTKTYGKGSIQTVMPLDREVGMKITTARYYTPSGRSLQDRGVLPDMEVAEVEAAMPVDGGPAAVAVSGVEVAETPEGRVQSPMPDLALHRALELLRAGAVPVGNGTGALAGTL